MLKNGVITPFKSLYAAAPVIVRKKDGTFRLAIDYRKVNVITEDFLYPLLKIMELFDHFKGTKVYSSLDLARGFWQIPMHLNSKKYTAFITPFGQYEFEVMPFGLKQALEWF